MRYRTPELQTRVILDHEAFRQPAPPRLFVAVLGLFFLCGGIVLLLTGCGALPVNANPESRTIARYLSVPFLFLGSYILGTLVMRSRWWRLRRVPAALQSAPELRDFPWDPRGMEDDSFAQLHLNWGIAGFFGTLCFAIVGGWLAVSETKLPEMSSPGTWLRLSLLALLLLFIAAVALQACILTWRYLTKGPVRLRFGAFPLRLGQPATLTLEPHPLFRGASEIRFTLRCVRQEEAPMRYKGRNVLGIEKRQVWAQEAMMEPAGAAREPGTIALTFALPASPELSTNRAARLQIWWELGVAADIPGLNYQGWFPMPVYA